MKNRRGAGSWTATIILTLYCMIAVVLIGNMIISSFKTKQDLLFNTFGLPTMITLENYVKIIVEDGFLRNFLNSLILTLLSITSLIRFPAEFSHQPHSYAPLHPVTDLFLIDDGIRHCTLPVQGKKFF